MIIKIDSYIDTDAVKQSKECEIKVRITQAEYKKLQDCKKEFHVFEDAKTFRRLLRLAFYQLQKQEPFKSLWRD